MGNDAVHHVDWRARTSAGGRRGGLLLLGGGGASGWTEFLGVRVEGGEGSGVGIQVGDNIVGDGAEDRAEEAAAHLAHVRHGDVVVVVVLPRRLLRGDDDGRGGGDRAGGPDLHPARGQVEWRLHHRRVLVVVEEDTEMRPLLLPMRMLLLLLLLLLLV